MLQVLGSKPGAALAVFGRYPIPSPSHDFYTSGSQVYISYSTISKSAILFRVHFYIGDGHITHTLIQHNIFTKV